METVNLQYFGVEELDKHAAHLNEINNPDPNARPMYELMPGAIIWSDETMPNTPTSVIWALRQLFAYRTYLILNNAEPDNPVWDHCVKLFPNWVGFRPERRKPTFEVLAEYRRGDVSMRWCIRNQSRD